MTADTACLLLHGFGGSPFEMEPLVPGLTSLGCTVDLPTLPGHDSSVGEFRRTFFPDWLAYAEDRYLSLCRSHKLVIPNGFSMGGSLALLMVVMAPGVPLITVATMPHVAAEIANTLVGSFGLVTAAPLTAVAGALLLAEGRKG